jgi:hypothetical protein
METIGSEVLEGSDVRQPQQIDLYVLLECAQEYFRERLGCL